MLILETLKRALSPMSRSRLSLVASAVSCGLVSKLLQLLDWQAAAFSEGAAGASVRQQAAQDAAVQRVLAVEVLHLLSDGDSMSATEVSVIIVSSLVKKGFLFDIACLPGDCMYIDCTQCGAIC